MVSRVRRLTVVVTLLIGSVLLAACAPSIQRPDDVRKEFVGTWMRSTHLSKSVLVLDDDGSFVAQHLPAALGGVPPGDHGRQLEACDANFSTVSVEGTWSIPEGNIDVIWLDSGGSTFGVGYKHFTSFFGSAFSIGFFVGTIDKPTPDYIFERVPLSDRSDILGTR